MKYLPPLTIQQPFPVSPETLYAAWTDSTQLNTWFFPIRSWSCYTLIDLKIGGQIHCELTNSDGLVHTIKGIYHQLQFPRAIAFTWTSAVIDNSLVRVLLEPNDSGTTLTITHDGLKTSDLIQHHIKGWTGCLDQLSIFLRRQQSQ